jgi:hypothetical protein
MEIQFFVIQRSWREALRANPRYNLKRNMRWACSKHDFVCKQICSPPQDLNTLQSGCALTAIKTQNEPIGSLPRPQECFTLHLGPCSDVNYHTFSFYYGIQANSSLLWKGGAKSVLTSKRGLQNSTSPPSVNLRCNSVYIKGFCIRYCKSGFNMELY